MMRLWARRASTDRSEPASMAAVVYRASLTEHGVPEKSDRDDASPTRGLPSLPRAAPRELNMFRTRHSTPRRHGAALRAGAKPSPQQRRRLR